MAKLQRNEIVEIEVSKIPEKQWLPWLLYLEVFCSIRNSTWAKVRKTDPLAIDLNGKTLYNYLQI